MSEKPTRWTPAQATNAIRECAASDDLDLHITTHAAEQMEERELLMGDLLHLLKRGFVYDEPEPATRGFFKYAVEGKTPNSDGRSVRAIVIPSGDCGVKIVTVMWRDER
jgi:hypothetical protein